MSGYSLNDKRTERGARTFESEGRAASRFHRPENSAESLPTVNINSSSNGLSWTAPLSHFLFVSCCCCLFFVLFVCLFLLPEVAVTLEVARLPWTHAYGPWTPRPK